MIPQIYIAKLSPNESGRHFMRSACENKSIER
jgi:hypothetical protein